MDKQINLPLLPVEEEGRLRDPRLRENFFERVYGHRRVRTFFASDWRPRDLVRFHAREKLLLLSHDPARCRELGRLVAEAGRHPREELARRYREVFMQALGSKASIKRQVNTLQHVAGFFKRSLAASEKAELVEVISDFRRGLAPLAVPLALLNHHAARLGDAWLSGQSYFQPHPKELRLRAVLPG